MPDTVKMPYLELFTGKHDGEIVRQFINACGTYFKLTGVKNQNTFSLFSRRRLFDTAHTWYDSKGYDNNKIAFSMLIAHLK